MATGSGRRGATTTGGGASARAGALVAAVGAVMMLAYPALAVETSTLGIKPAAGDEWFRFGLVPGEHARSKAVVINNTAVRVPVRIYAVDALTTPQGGFGLRNSSEPRAGVGAWITLPYDRMVLEPRSRVEVPFTLQVPRSAEPGDYAGGIVIESAASKGRATDVGESFSLQLNIVERVGARTFVRVEGDVVRVLSGGELGWTRTSDGSIRFSMPVTNTGNVRLTPKASLELSGWRMDRPSLKVQAPAMLLPGAHGVLTATWRNPPAAAWGTATMTVRYGAREPLRARTGLRVVPVLPLTASLLFLVVAALLATRLARYLARARRALAALERNEGPEELAAPVPLERAREQRRRAG